MKTMQSLVFGSLLVLLVETPIEATSLGTVWKYVLLPGSELVDSCLICGRPDIVVPLRGAFQLRLTEENPLFSTYAVENFSCTAGEPAGSYYVVAGKGTHRIGGELALRQEMVLEVQIDNGYTNTLCYLTNDSPAVTRLWPMLEVGLDQTNGTLLQQFRLKLIAAPMHEIWFSTRTSLHNALWQPPTNFVSSGDLLSSSGRVVKRNQVLTRALGIMPPVADLGLKDFDILPGGEIAFAIEENVFSETLGPLETGDLLSDRGRFVARNSELIAAFMPQPPVESEGVKAVQVLDTGEIYFSVQTNFYSEALRREVKAGDLLSSRGFIVRDNASLLARFSPADPKADYGLQAVYVWPSSEIWFSLETGFMDTRSNVYSPGDLLSDQGYVIYRNLDLLNPFAPVEDVSNFGLDALFVVTDVTPPPPAPVCVEIRVKPLTSDVELRYQGQARVFQLEKASSLGGPWVPAGPIGPDLDFVDAGALQALSQSFYRLRAW
jgi:hypothetical protein